MIGYDAVAVETVQAVRVVVNTLPRLRELDNELAEGPSSRAIVERGRRMDETVLYRELSKYYAPPGETWSRNRLLARGKQGLLGALATFR